MTSDWDETCRPSILLLLFFYLIYWPFHRTYASNLPWNHSCILKQGIFSWKRIGLSMTVYRTTSHMHWSFLTLFPCVVQRPWMYHNILTLTEIPFVLHFYRLWHSQSPPTHERNNCDRITDFLSNSLMPNVRGPQKAFNSNISSFIWLNIDTVWCKVSKVHKKSPIAAFLFSFDLTSTLYNHGSPYSSV